MKYFLSLFFLFFTPYIFCQYYDNFDDGNYTENPKWFSTNLDITITRDNGKYVAELEKSNDNDGCIKTTNYLTSDTYWGCKMVFTNDNSNTGIIDYVLSSYNINILTATGYFVRINTGNNSISFLYSSGADSELLLAQSGNILPSGECDLTLKISNNSGKWDISAIHGSDIIWQGTANHSSETGSIMSGINIRGFYQGYKCTIKEIYCGQESAPEADINPDDIVFSEIMHKPTENSPMPNAEWVEIYNRTDRSVSLENCQLSSSSKNGIIGQYTLSPQAYVILCSKSSAEKMKNITSHIVEVTNMPALLNDGDLLVLKDENNNQICHVQFSNTWYSDEISSDGGWSLEKKDVSSLINDSRNWGTSCSSNQATPGEENCLKDELADTIIPRITGLEVKNDKEIAVYFNKEMNASYCTIDKISISGPGKEITSCSWLSPKNTTLEIFLHESMDKTHATTIEFNDFVCSNNIVMQDTSVKVGLPHDPGYMDVVINEIMPYVSEGQSKFIELYNNTPYFISTNSLRICNVKEEAFSNCKSLPASLIIPYGYAIISNNTENINCILGTNENCVYLNTTLPSFAGKSGNIAVTDNKGTIIDALSYSEKWHHGIINDNHNVSLERINPMGNSNDSLNWHSASSIYNFQSGGWQNSHYRETGTAEDGSNKNFRLESNTFTPNNDGINDLMILKYSLPESGYIVTITLYTRDGYEVGTLAENLLLNQKGEWIWQGNNPNGGLIEAGLYILKISAYNLEGDKIEAKIIFVKD